MDATVSEWLNLVFRWIHVVAGVMWIGHLWFFNFVNAQVAKTYDADAKKKVIPELMPRALYWFRWGAAWTWVFGFLLVLLVFYHGQLVFDMGHGWNALAIVMVLITFLAFAVYDPIAKMEFAKNNKQMAGVGFVLITAVILGYVASGMSYRSYVIHTGALFGTLMAANVWMRIWPAQKLIITAIRDGQAPPADKVALAGQRSRHNTYMSIPLVWTMINSHTTVPFASTYLWLIFMIGAGWGLAVLCYKKAAQVKGF